MLSKDDKKARYEIHSHLKQATFDFDKNQFNTVVSACMKILNTLNDYNNLSDVVKTEGLSILLKVIAPFIPHIAHSLWIELKLGEDILKNPFPIVDEKALNKDDFLLVIQINGKVKGKIELNISLSKEQIENEVLNNENIKSNIDGKEIIKIIYIPQKLMNIVIK
jgi:leucyl-tRNA synthetase